MKYTGYLLYAILLIVACTGTPDQPKEEVDIVNDQTLLMRKIDELKERIKADPTNPDLFYKQYKLLWENGQKKAAVSHLETALKLDSLNPGYWNEAADKYLILERSKEAKEALERTIALEPGNEKALLSIAELYFYVMDYQKSIGYIDRALKVNEYNASAYFLKGLNFKELGDTTKAISSFLTATEQDPDHYDSFIQLGLLHAAKGDPLAVQYYQNALLIKPQSTEAIYNTAMYYQGSGKIDQALEKYDQLLSVDSTNVDALFNKGVIFSEYKKEYNIAIDLFRKSLEYNPDMARSVCGIAYSYEMMGENEKAKEYYRSALEVEPDFKLAIERLKDLEK